MSSLPKRAVTSRNSGPTSRNSGRLSMGHRGGSLRSRGGTVSIGAAFSGGFFYVRAYWNALKNLAAQRGVAHLKSWWSLVLGG